ncbi:MAG: VOC family protein [Terriglobales bacterium]
MINSDQRSPNISTDAFRGHPDLRSGPDFFAGIFAISVILNLLLALCKLNCYFHPSELHPKRRNDHASESYLFFDGQCEAAFKFDEKLLGGKIEAMMTHKGTPAATHVPVGWRSKIMHARLVLGDQVLMGSDAPPDHQQKPQGFSVNISVDDPAVAARIFHALEEDGKVTMPFGETFWAMRFGMFVDRYGIPWMVNCEKVAEKAA